MLGQTETIKAAALQAEGYREGQDPGQGHSHSVQSERVSITADMAHEPVTLCVGAVAAPLACPATCSILAFSDGT